MTIKKQERLSTLCFVLVSCISLILACFTDAGHCFQLADSTVVTGESLPTGSRADNSAEAQTEQPHQITVVAPKSLRPQSTYIILLTLANSSTPAAVDLELTGGRDSDREQTEARSVLMESGQTQMVTFVIGDWPPAEYFLNVTANAVDRSWHFHKEAPVSYHVKSFSGLIQTDKPIYKPGDKVQFRVVFLGENLAPISLKDEINVSISDPRKNIVRQWGGLSTFRGLLTLEMALSEDPQLGDWMINVEARGQQASKPFVVAEYVLPTYDVQIQLPPYATYNQSRVVASVRATYTYGKPVSGHVTLTVQPLVRFANIHTRPLDQFQYRARLSEGKADFEVETVGERLKREPNLFEREIEFFALVEEDLTGRKYNRTKTIKLYNKPIKIERLRRETETFKPGLSQLLQYKVAYQDDTPVEDHSQPVVLHYSFFDQTIGEFSLRPVGGLIEHQLMVPSKVTRPTGKRLSRPIESFYNETQVSPSHLSIKANYRGQTHHLSQMLAFQSESGHYLQISLPQLQRRASRSSGAGSERVNVGDQLKIHLQATEPFGAQVVCQGMARGNVLWALSKDGKNKTELEFEVQVDTRMAPKAQVVCHYVRPENREIVADRVEVPVSGFMRNFVKLSPSKEELKPGQELELGVITRPSSLVGVLAIDQSVLLLKQGNDIDSKQVLEENKKFGGSNTNQDDQLQPTTTSDLFDEANLIVLTNNLLSGPKLNPMNAIELLSASKIILKDEVLDHEIQPPEFHLKGRKSGEQVRIRRDFPETWLWQNGTADESGRLAFSGKVPDTITSWQVSAFSLSEAYGFGLAPGQADGKQPTTIRVFRPFFIKLNLPYSLIRDETVSIQAVVFNYSKRPLTARVSLDNSRGELEFVEAANSVEEEKHSNETSQTKTVRVPANDGASVSFLIKPTKLGHIDIKVVAQSELVGDGVVRKLLVKPEGQIQRLNRAFLVSLPHSNGSSLFERNVTIEVPGNAVRDSRKVQVSAVGDILGAGLANVDNLLHLPSGCGEQNMVHLVPNIVIYNYLLNTRRLRDAQRRRAKRNIETGYQRELNYKRRDGSFSAFGDQDNNGSLWLTAYVLKTLKQARQIVSVDPEVLQQASGFITRFAREDGSFEPVGMLHNRRLASAAADNSSLYLTGYVLIALLDGPDSEKSNEEREIIQKALAHLERHLEFTQNPYELAIISYAMQLARNQEAADRAYEKLWRFAKENEDQMWFAMPQVATSPEEDREKTSDDETPRSEELDPMDSEASSGFVSERERSQRLSVPPLLKPPLAKGKQSAHLFAPNSLSIEASSFALLSAVLRNDLERALPIVRWLVGQQNSQGGFASTQDTVLAIEALARFAEATGQKQQSLDIEIVSPRTNKQTSQFRTTNIDPMQITQANSLVHQQLRLDDNVTWVLIRATGSGSAVVQASWQYNLVVSAEKPAFYLNPVVDRSSTVNYLQLTICTFYKAGETSNMAVAEVELPSGYVADAEALPGLRRHKSIKRVDTEEGETKVIVYLERVTRDDELCFTIPAYRSTRVSNNQPVSVFIYDYYDRKKAARVFYEPRPASSCDICETDSCGDQCNSRPKKSAKLVSLHEQRRLAGHLGSPQAPADPKSGRISSPHHEGASQRGESSPVKTNFTIPSAKELLPLTLDSIKEAFKKVAEA